MATPPLSLVSNSAVWHLYDWTTGLTIKSIDGTNWDWDGRTDLWWRGWVIVDGASLGLSTWTIGDGTPMDGSRVLGSTATVQQVQAVQRIVQKWKPANVYVDRIIVTFTSGVFDRSNDGPTPGPWVGPEYNFLMQDPVNPGGEYGDPANWNPNATYWLGGGEEP